jgi:hypothetical protein
MTKQELERLERILRSAIRTGNEEATKKLRAWMDRKIQKN